VPDPYVRMVGSLSDLDDAICIVGVDYDSVSLSGPGSLAWRFNRTEAEEFARVFTAACWEAGLNVTRMAGEA